VVCEVPGMVCKGAQESQRGLMRQLGLPVCLDAAQYSLRWSRYEQGKHRQFQTRSSGRGR
jgi:hypothetical protein